MKPTKPIIEAVDHFTEMPATRFSKALRSGLLHWLVSDQEAGGNLFFPDLCHGLNELFMLLDAIEEEQAKNIRFKESETTQP